MVGRHDGVSACWDRRKSMLPVRFSIPLIPLLLAPVFAVTQPDFRLAMDDLPKPRELSSLPLPLGEIALRERLDGSTLKRPPAEEVLKQAVDALKTHQFESALPKLEYLQSLRPSDPDILILRGCIYAEAGHNAEAEAIFKKAILIAPAHPWARLNLAEAQLSQKKFPDAETTLSILSSTRPESEVVRFKLIITLVLQKKTAAAERELQQLEEHATTPAYYFSKASMAFASGDQKAGQALVDEATKIYGITQTGYFINSLAAQGWVPKPS